MTDGNFNDAFEGIMDSEGFADTFDDVLDDVLVDASFDSMMKNFGYASFVAPLRPHESLPFEKYLESAGERSPAPDIDIDMEPISRQ